MFIQNQWFDTAALDTLYRVYEGALHELREHSEETSWQGSDDDMIALASRVLDLAFLGERDATQLRRGAMRHFGYVEADSALAAA
jgi:hypothetical protein